MQKSEKVETMQIPDEKKQVIQELVKEVETINNIAKIRFILSIVRSYKKGGAKYE